MIIEILEYNKISEAYELFKTLKNSDVIEYTFVEQDHPNDDELTIRFKPLSFFRELIPTKKTDNLKPLIIRSKIGLTERWISFITEREFVETREDRYVEFSGVGFTFFNRHKLINATTDNPEIGEELPEGFATYSKNANMQTHLSNAYSTYANPKELTFGVLSVNDANYRKFKGIGSINITLNSTTNKSIRTEQKPLEEFIKQVYELYGKMPVTRQKINNGKVDITISEPVALDGQITKRLSEIQESLRQQTLSRNLVFATGWGNNYNTVWELKEWDFTTLEKSEDVAFVSRDSTIYLTNTAKTYLRREIENTLVNLLKVNLRNVFVEVRCGDILGFNGLSYRIKKIQENYSLDDYSVDVDIEQV